MVLIGRLRSVVVAVAGALVAVGVVVLMVVLVEARPAEATFPGQNGKIAYTRYSPLDNDIYTINPDGGGEFQLTNNDTGEFSPDFSPDGKKIAYERFDGDKFSRGEWEIYTINVGGGGRFNVTNNDGEYSSEHNPSWGSRP
jgi:Tol biopolymer transport system component